jgi:hypothetical protein
MIWVYPSRPGRLGDGRPDSLLACPAAERGELNRGYRRSACIGLVINVAVLRALAVPRIRLTPPAPRAGRRARSLA